VGAGAVSDGAMDASNIIKPFLTQGTLRFIGSTTYEEYKKYFEKTGLCRGDFKKLMFRNRQLMTRSRYSKVLRTDMKNITR